MKKILIVDDEKDIRELLKDKLIQSKYQVITASSGQEAIDICKENHPDLILLDIAMPELDGYQTCEKLKGEKESKGIPVLFLSGKDLDSRGLEERCSSLSARGHISKLSTLKELLDKVRETIG